MSIYKAGPTHANHPYHLPFSEENDFLDSDSQYYRYTIRYIIQFFDVKLIIYVSVALCVFVCGFNLFYCFFLMNFSRTDMTLRRKIVFIASALIATGRFLGLR